MPAQRLCSVICVALLVCACAVYAEPAQSDASDDPQQELVNEVAVGSSVAKVAIPPFSHYEVILARKPFGDIAKRNDDAHVVQPPDAVAAQQAQEEQKLAKQIDMVAVNRTPSGKIAVGFVDKSEKPPKNFYVCAGDSAGGYTVVSANFEEETATIEKDGVSISMKLGKGLIPKNDTGVEPSVNTPTDSVTKTPFVGVSGLKKLRLSQQSKITENAADAARNSPVSRGSYRDQLIARGEKERAKRSNEDIAKLRVELSKLAENASAEAVKKRERQMNIELISRGQEPLSPIELTPEEDAELVRRGAFSGHTAEPQ